MNRFRSHIALICILLVATNSTAQDDSVRVRELLVLDTLELKIDGPSSDVNFYMNGMVFLSNTKYHQKMIPDHITFGVVKAYFVPLEYIALESSRPLFVNDNFPGLHIGIFNPGYRSTAKRRCFVFNSDIGIDVPVYPFFKS